MGEEDIGKVGILGGKLVAGKEGNNRDSLEKGSNGSWVKGEHDPTVHSLYCDPVNEADEKIEWLYADI